MLQKWIVLTYVLCFLVFAEMMTSPQGVYFTVTWGTDENGNLIPTDTVEYEMVQREMLVTCPHNTGSEAQINVEGSLVTVVIPARTAVSGQRFGTCEKGR